MFFWQYIFFNSRTFFEDSLLLEQEKQVNFVAESSEYQSMFLKFSPILCICVIQFSTSPKFDSNITSDRLEGGCLCNSGTIRKGMIGFTNFRFSLCKYD